MNFVHIHTIELIYNIAMDLDLGVRIAAFKWLTEQNMALGDVLPRSLLLQGFLYEGQRIPLVSPQGIFKPKIMSFPLSITTVFEGPYDDRSTAEGTLFYKYRGTDPNHRDNVGLRELMKMNRPLAYFYGISPGQHMTIWPVYIVGDDPEALSFRVALDAIDTVADPPDINSNDAQIRRAYLTASVKMRLHQRSFRERVLEAYRSTCAFCKLRHRELLDAAHIVPDAIPPEFHRFKMVLHYANFITLLLTASCLASSQTTPFRLGRML